MAEQEQQQPVVVEKKKWYEEQGGFGFEIGDVVLIEKSMPTIGHRFCEILGPSDKAGYIKGKLQNQKSGELQGTTVVLENKLLTLVAKNGIGSDVLPEMNEICVMEASGIYKTHEQVAAEVEKMKNRRKNAAEAADGEQELAQAQ